MFRAAYRSSSGPLTVFAASGLHTPCNSDFNQFEMSHIPYRELDAQNILKSQQIHFIFMYVIYCIAVNTLKMATRAAETCC